MARYDYFGYSPYVPVAERRRQAQKKVAALQKKGKAVSPVRIEGRAIARTFWGKAWCDHLEAYSDFSNRLPRGRTYVRNGSVIDLQIGEGKVEALVSGSSIYKVEIRIRALDEKHWKQVISACSGQIDSLVELLQGKFSQGVMEVITDHQGGLFPSPRQISMSCSCPDGAVMCKHVAAVLYGVGARLDQSPELFFRLRGVDHAELITAAGASRVATKAPKSAKILKSPDLEAVFGIELDPDASPLERRAPAPRPRRTASPGRTKKKVARRGRSRTA